MIEPLDRIPREWLIVTPFPYQFDLMAVSSHSKFSQNKSKITNRQCFQQEIYWPVIKQWRHGVSGNTTWK